MTTRKLLAIIIALALVLGMLVCLSGCSETENFELTESEIGGLIAVSKQSYVIEGFNLYQYNLYDPDTLVMYAFISKPNGAAMSVMYNADGTPKLYNPDK